MSLFGMMRTGTAGMNAQASRLSTVADNIANSSTTGYKRASTEFSSLVLPSVGGNYNSGAIETSLRYAISEQGALEYTSSSTDLALNGEGFFIVESDAGTPYLTRAGSFQLNSDGELVNAAGFKLLGYDYSSGDPTPVINGFDGLEAIKVGSASLTAGASTTGVFTANLDSGADIVTGDLPSDNLSTSEYTHTSSLVAYDSLGNERLFDFYYTKTADNEWEVAVYASDDATGDPFPYSTTSTFATSQTSYPVTATLTFDPSTGKLDAASAEEIMFTVPGGEDLTIDLSSMTQLSYNFNVDDATVNGNSPSLVKSVEVSEDGIVYASYENGTLEPLYRLALANVESPDKLTPKSGNVYQQGIDSGVIITGFAGNGAFGTVTSGALESSNVDIAEELTSMIESQRSYTANSKVFQTGSDLMEQLVNLVR